MDREHLAIINLYLLPDLGRMVIPYLTVKEVLVQEWRDEQSEEGEQSEDEKRSPSYDQVIAVRETPQGNEIYVVDCHNSFIQVLLEEKRSSGESNIKLLYEWGKEDNRMTMPSSIAIPPGRSEIFVVDVWESCVRVFSLERKSIRRWGNSDEERNPFYYFRYPRGIAVTTSKVYVADTYDKTIKAFTLEGEFLHKWGNASIFKEPVDIAVSPNEREIYVFDQRSQQVITFDVSESSPFEAKLLGRWSIDKGMSTNMALGDGEIYLSCRDNCIRVFSLNGKFRREIRASKGIIKPAGLAFYKDRLYVFDGNNLSVKIYQRTLD
jgi:DNA-binding beta-propeller fold protein YncE